MPAKQSAWRCIMLDVPPVPQAPLVQAEDVSLTSCTISWHLPQPASASPWARAPPSPKACRFWLQVQGPSDADFRAVLEGSEAKSCHLVGLEEGARVSVRVCYEEETGRSHWRYLNVLTKMAPARQQIAAGAYIFKVLARQASARLSRSEISAAHEASVAQLLDELDPEAKGTFTDGSDEALYRLVHLCISTDKFVVERREGKSGREVRLVPDLLCNPIALQRLVRHAGFNHIIDSLLQSAASAMEQHSFKWRRERDLGELVKRQQRHLEELGALRALIRLSASMREYIVRFPSTSIGSLLQQAVMHRQEHAENGAEEKRRAETSAQESNLWKMMRAKARIEVEQAVDLVEGLKAEEGALARVEAASGVRRYLQAAAEAGVFELFEGAESQKIEADVENAAESMHELGQNAGKRRLCRLLADTMLAPAAESGRAVDDDQGSAAVRQVTHAADDGGRSERDVAVGAAEAHLQAEVEAANLGARSAASGQAAVEEERRSQASTVSQVAALLQLGAMQGGSEARAFMRLDLSVDLDAAAQWDAKSAHPRRTGKEEVKTARGGGAESKQDGVRAIRSALVSAIYSSGHVDGLIARVVRLENLPAPSTHKLRVWRRVPSRDFAGGDAGLLAAPAAGADGAKQATQTAGDETKARDGDGEAGSTSAGEMSHQRDQDEEFREEDEHGQGGYRSTGHEGAQHDDRHHGHPPEGSRESADGAEEAYLSAGQETLQEQEMEVEMEVEARSFAVVQLSRTADTTLRLMRKAATADDDDGASRGGSEALPPELDSDEPDAWHAASRLCGKAGWLKSRSCWLYGSLLVDARASAACGLTCFLVLRLVVSMGDLLRISEHDFRTAICDDVARAHAAISGPAGQAPPVSVVKIAPRRNYVMLEIGELSKDSDMAGPDMPGSAQPSRTASISRVSSSSRKVQGYSEKVLLNKLQDASVCEHASKWVVSAVTMRGTIPPLMPGERAQLKLFNSSTFSDMHSERDFLNGHVYPAMRAVGLDRRIDLSWIDFRWGGVTADDSNSKLGIVRCLDKIQECSLPLQPGVSLPLVVALLGQRCGWVPPPDAPERQQAARRYPWTLPAKGGEGREGGKRFVGPQQEEGPQEPHGLPRADDYSRYSVTGLEMALAHLRFPHAAECFFFVRDSALLASDSWKRLPEAARRAFEDGDQAEEQADAFSADYLRSLVQRYGAGRLHAYTAALGRVPYSFSSCLVMNKAKAKLRDVRERERGAKGALPPGDMEQIRAQKREAVSWWLLLVEQESHEWRSQISDLNRLGGLESREVDEGERWSAAASMAGDLDVARRIEDSSEGQGLVKGQQAGDAKARRVLAELESFVQENRATFEEWIQELGQDAPQVGNTNVAAEGVNLTTGTLAPGVMMSLMEVLDACYPEPSKMPADAYYQVQEAQAAYMEELSSTFVCIPEGSRIAALGRLDDALHPDEGCQVEAVVVLLGDANSGRSALLARFLHNHLYVVRDKQMLEQDYAFVAAQGGGKDENVCDCRSVHLLDDPALLGSQAAETEKGADDTASRAGAGESEQGARPRHVFAETSWSRPIDSGTRPRRCPLAPVQHRIVSSTHPRPPAVCRYAIPS